MPDLRLSGCRSRPLLGYLKALGVLRVVANQVDVGARGRWVGGIFELRGPLDRDGLVAFFADTYVPAPVISPWNGGSGFHRGGNPAPRRALEKIESSTNARLRPLREAIGVARETLRSLDITEKPGDDRALKARVVRELRRRLSDDALAWLDTAVVPVGNDLAFPPLLGAGGTDGNWDFSTNYVQSVGELLAGDGGQASAASIDAALFATPVELQRELSLGHLSRDVSPSNSPQGEADSLGNPWDLILAVEGTLVLAAGASRRHGALSGGTPVAPFTAHSTASGYGSAAPGEAGKAELWLPLWSGWASHSEVSTLVRESRAEVGSHRRRRQAATGLDFVRAAAGLGVARGIAAFERYTILERAGQSRLAVPVGGVSVAARPAASALSSIDSWLTSLLRFAARQDRPGAPRRAIRRLEQAAFQLAARGERRDAADVIEAIGGAEHALARSARSASEAHLRPLARVPAAPWIDAADDGSPELAVATAIASLADADRTLPAVRDYLHGTRINFDGGAPRREFDPDRRHAVLGRDATTLLAALHSRRHLDATRSAQGAEATAPLSWAYGAWSDLDATRLFVAGRLDNRRIVRLLLGLAVLDHRQTRRVRLRSAVEHEVVPSFDLLALVWNGSSLGRHDHRPDPNPGWAARLEAGAVAPVLKEALLKLTIAGLRPRVRLGDLLAGAPEGPRLSAALLMRIGPRDADALARKLTLVDEDENATKPTKED